MNTLKEFRAAVPASYTDAPDMCNAIMSEVYMFSALVHGGILSAPDSYGGVYISPAVVLPTILDPVEHWGSWMYVASGSKGDTENIADYTAWDNDRMTTHTVLTIKNVTLSLCISIKQDPPNHYRFHVTCASAEQQSHDTDDESMGSDMDTETDSSFHGDDTSDDSDAGAETQNSDGSDAATETQNSDATDEE